MGSITRVGCFAHVRRKFRDGIPKTATTSKSQCEIGKSYCDQLFGIERKIAYLIPEERLEKLPELLQAYLPWSQEIQTKCK